MIEGAVQLNRFGLERGRLWPAILVLLAVFAPAVVWTQWNNAVDGEQPVPDGTVYRLEAAPNPGAAGHGGVTFTVPGPGWVTDKGTNKSNSVILVAGSVVVRVQAVAGVGDLKVLFDRQSRDLRVASRVMFTTGSREYTSPGGLTGYWGDLTGDRYGGALVVVGHDGAAAVITAAAPLGSVESQMDDITRILTGLEVRGGE